MVRENILGPMVIAMMDNLKRDHALALEFSSKSRDINMKESSGTTKNMVKVDS